MTKQVRLPALFCRPLQAGALLGVLPLLIASHVQAVELSLMDGQVEGSLDTTLSYGTLWRVQGRDDTGDINADDGNRNFDTGLVSEVYKVTSDLALNYQNYGLFVRGTGHYDTQIMDKRNDYYGLSDSLGRPSQAYPHDDRFTDESRDVAGHNVELLDAYLFGNWDIGDMPLSAKVGRQVISWGEGIFYRGGVNAINPVDAAKYNLPGSEIKEVLMPIEAFSFNLGLTESLSLEAYYQWTWEETRLNPVGTFFGGTDLFADGGNTAYTTEEALAPVLAFHELAADFGFVGNGPFGRNAYVDPSTGTFKVANIGNDLSASDDGQFGLALRYIAEELNATEFGFYFINYHAKEPQLTVDLTGYDGIDIEGLTDIANALLPGAGDAVPGVATIDMASNAVARRRYVEDVRMYGFSFNTTVGDASFSGELAYRPNAPVAITATDDILGDLLIPGVLGISDVANSNVAADQACTPVSGKMLCRGSLFDNYERAEMFNVSLSSIYNFGPRLSFDSLFGVVEVASQHIRGSSLKYTAYDGSERVYTSAADKAYVTGNGDDWQIDRDSYGYTLLLSGSWNDVFAGVQLSPFFVFQHDFQGNSDRVGNFIENNKAFTVGMDALYLNSFQVGLQYTQYDDGNSGSYDRDNISLTGKYSF